jgi:CRISPR-associated protein Cas5t
VAKAQKTMGNNFRKGITIDVENEKLLQEYRNLKDLNDSIDDFKKTRLKKLQDHLKNRRENYAKLKKQYDKKTEEYKEYERKEKRIKSFENKVTNDFKAYKAINYDIPFSKFKTINKSLKYYEVLYGVKLIIHISSDEETMQCILDNIYNLKSIGRSEDFVDVVDAEMVDLYDEIDKDEISSPYSAYLNLSAVRDDCIFTKTKDESHSVSGTKYVLNKIYDIVDGKRIFKDKKRVLYASEYFIEECNEDYGIYYDGEYIVSFM